jgi:hypothetical protein
MMMLPVSRDDRILHRLVVCINLRTDFHLDIGRAFAAVLRDVAPGVILSIDFYWRPLHLSKGLAETHSPNIRFGFWSGLLKPLSLELSFGACLNLVHLVRVRPVSVRNRD